MIKLMNDYIPSTDKWMVAQAFEAGSKQGSPCHGQFLYERRVIRGLNSKHPHQQSRKLQTELYLAEEDVLSRLFPDSQIRLDLNDLCSPKPSFAPRRNLRRGLNLSVTNAEGGGDSASAADQILPSSATLSSPSSNDQTVFVGEESVPLEGVIQLEKPRASSQLNKWGRVALLAGGDVLALVLFAAIGRFSHGFRVVDIETLRTADPFIAGWFLSAYFFGGYGEDGRGMNGMSRAVIAATKSWAVGIPEKGFEVFEKTQPNGKTKFTVSIGSLGSHICICKGLDQWNALYRSCKKPQLQTRWKDMLGKSLDAVEVVTFDCPSTSTVHARSFLFDLKRRHYMKIPPRAMFTAQLAGTIVAGVVNLGVAWWMQGNIENISDVEQLNPNSPWTCPKFEVTFDSSVLWGLIGPKRLFGPGGMCRNLVWLFLGAILPVLVWLLSKMFLKINGFH